MDPRLVPIGLSVLVLFSALLTGPSPSPAQEIDVTAKGKEIETTGPILADTTIPQEKGTWQFFVAPILELEQGTFDSHGKRKGTEGSAASLAIHFSLYYGLTERTELYAVVPCIRNWASDVPLDGRERSAQFGGLGDSSIAVKHLLAEEKGVAPAVSALFLVGLPTGPHRSPSPRLLGTDVLGTGSFTFTAGFNLYKLAGKTKLYGNAWYAAATNARVGDEKIRPRDVVTLNGAVEYPLTERWVLLGELLSAWDAGRVLARTNRPPSALFSVLPAVEFVSGKALSAAAGVRLDIAGRNSACGYGPVLALFYDFR